MAENARRMPTRQPRVGLAEVLVGATMTTDGFLFIQKGKHMAGAGRCVVIVCSSLHKRCAENKSPQKLQTGGMEYTRVYEIPRS